MRRSTTSSAASLKVLDAIVLAGGQSRRLQRDKVRLELPNGRVLANLIDLCRDLFAAVTIVVDRADRITLSRPGVRVVTDEIPGSGPLGGILTGLRASRYDRSFVTACDLPFLHRELIRFVGSHLSDQDVLVPGLGESVEPLVGFYAKRCVNVIQSSIAKGDLRVRGFWPAVRTEIVELGRSFRETDVRTWLHNVNTRNDLEVAESVATSGSWK